jgi:hypothetical protein
VASRAQAARQVQSRQEQRDAALAKLRGRKPAERSFMLILDNDVAEEHERAKNGVFFAERAGSKEDLRAAQRKLTAAEAKLADASVEFVFRFRGRVAYEKLVTDHPPGDDDLTEEQRSSLNQQYGMPDSFRPPFNLKTFPPALIALSLESPELTEAELVELSETQLSSGEWGMFFQTALQLHTQARVAELEK